MNENIQDYDLGADESIVDHDAVATAQAGKLLKIGYLEYEIAAYGTAIYQNGDIHYYISAREESMLQFTKDCYLKGLYPSPVKYFFKRYDLLHHSEEEIRQKFRLDVAGKLQAAYPQRFFDSVNALTKPLNANAAWLILDELTKQLDNCFDLKQLKIFENLLNMLLPARLLNIEGHRLLQQWLTNEYEKLSIEPTKAGAYQRTYAGFAYQKSDGQTAYFSDAVPYMAQEKQVLFLSQGYLVTPILTHTYYADSYPQLGVIKENFKADLLKYLGQSYLGIMQLLRSLPSVIDQNQFVFYLQELEKEDSAQAIEALRYYGYLWNVL